MSSNVIEVTYSKDFRELFKVKHNAWRMRIVVHLIRRVSDLRIMGLDFFGVCWLAEMVGIFHGTIAATEVRDFLWSLNNADRVCLHAYIVGDINNVQRLEICITAYNEDSGEEDKVERIISYASW